jgi:hypothetical protein
LIYICIPVLNEAQTVGVLLWRTRQVMAEFGRDYHIVVVDDGSTDASSEVLQPYTRVLPLTVVRHERNRGYAAALETLVREVASLSTHPKRDVAVFLQADFTEPPEEIPALVRRLEGGADVVGSTVAAVDVELTRGMRWSRRGLPWLLKRSALPREIRDPFCGFRGYRVQVLRRALSDADGKPLLERAGWAANAELLVRVAPHARRAEEAEVKLRYAHRERETRFRPWDALRETWALFRATPGISTLPRRAAEAPAAAEPAPVAAEAPARPAPRREERPAAPRPEREGRPERDDQPARDERPARPRRERRPADEAGAEAAPPKRSRPERTRPPREERAAVPAGEAETLIVVAPADAGADASAEAAEPVVKKRKPRRRKPRRTEGGDAPAAAEGASDAGASGEEASGEGAEAGTGEAEGEQAASEGGARKRPRRPRRRRKPAGPNENGADGGADDAPASESEG